jgi:Ser/Thr protein kinase RdoA (MazF antagonist)
MNAVREFEDFTPNNDPYKEHDMAFFDVGGEKYFFKFDYYDDNYKFFKEDGNRVLTIGRAHEY